MPPKKEKKVTIDPAATPARKSNYRLHRSHKQSFQEKYDEEMRSHSEEMSKLRAKIEAYNKDSERLVRQQQLKFGSTLDDIRVVQSELESARSSNEYLLDEMKRKKREYDMLESTLEESKSRLSSIVTELGYYRKEKRIFDQEYGRLTEAESVCSGLMKSNNKMRLQLLKHNVNPEEDPKATTKAHIHRRHSLTATNPIMPMTSRTPSGSTNKARRLRETKSLTDLPGAKRISQMLPQIHEGKAMTHRDHRTGRRGTWANLTLPAVLV